MSRPITFAVILGLAGLVFGIVDQSILMYLAGGVALGYTMGVCADTALSAQ
jgi:hypothetical protein